jgi:exonuclease III
MRPPTNHTPITRHTTAFPLNKKKRTSANLKIATLNIRGRNATTSNGSNNKWRDLNQLLRDSRTGIIALQETHLTEETVDEIHTLFSSRMKVVFSQGDNTRAAGVAFVINKDLSIHQGIVTHELIPGRALLMSVPWHSNLLLTILNVYAPNAPAENEKFWQDLSGLLDSELVPYPDILLGDFNMVEDAIDRLPSHSDNANTCRALSNLKKQLDIRDGWRNYNGNEKGYTYTQKPNMIRSRIDRIYTTQKVFETAEEWDISTPPIETDHCLTSVRISDPSLPWSGPGRWKLPSFLLKDRAFKSETKKLAKDLGEDINKIHARTHNNNPQLLFKAFKEKVKETAIAQAKTAIPKITKSIILLKQEHQQIVNDRTLTDLERMAKAGPIAAKITQLEQKKFQKAKNTTKTHFALEGETISKYWSNLNKEKKQRDPIFSLRKPNCNPPKFETNSTRMAEIARKYHEDLLSSGLHPDETERETAIEDVLGEVSNDSILSDLAKAEMDKPINSDIIRLALSESANNTAPGINGIPYEFWKMLATPSDTATQDKGREPSYPEDGADPDIIETLTKIYGDIEKYGVHEDSAFAEGWMCPLYKKKDRRDISNYRPITLLNTDYKIYTKAIATKLAQVAPNIIHPNQAGFMPGRSIFDQVRLAKMMVHYAEATETNGLIVALDQEKAYDKISHEYLWRTLEKYNLPQRFINMVRSLYESAETVVIVNGAISKPFQVSRGVRQGDPLSCLLFNIAIEPLANLLRKNDQLEGFNIPGIGEKLITNLFADDTTVYLGQNDSFDDLTDTLDLWCKASGAKFNVNKTEIIPIGSEAYRNEVLITRRPAPLNPTIGLNIHIAKEQEPTRILGGWVGNGIDEQAIWSKNIDKINQTLERWEKRQPTTLSRRLIVQMFAGGISQFMTTVQGMPKDVEDQIQRLISAFVWGGDRATVKLDQARQPLEKGGFKLLDIRARNEAIDIMWLKTYLTLNRSRPIWAFVADVLIEESIAKSNKIDRNVTANTYLQNWSPSLAPNSKLPLDLKRMLKVGRKYNASLSAISIPRMIKKRLPAWYHLGAEETPRGFNRLQTTQCLKQNHRIDTVGDLVRLTNRLRTADPANIHQDLRDCPCTPCTADRGLNCSDPNRCCRSGQDIIGRLREKWNPLRSSENADDLTLTHRRKKTNAEARKNKSAILFNPSIKVEGNIEAYFRVFADPSAMCQDPGLRPTRPAGTVNIKTTVYVEGAHRVENGDQEKTGCGLWYGQNDPRNASLRVESGRDPKHTGVLNAALWAISEEPPFNDLLIKTTSRTLTNGILENLTDWETTNYAGVEHKDLFRAIAARLRNRGASTSLQQTPKAANELGTKEACELAKAGTHKEVLDEPDLTIIPKFNITGAQLSKMTQKVAYRNICDHKLCVRRRGTAQMLDITRYEILRAFQIVPSDSAVWNSSRNKDFSKPFRTFLWKTLHQAQKIGAYWLAIPNFEHRGTCQTCGVIEDMEHITLNCDIPGSRIIWNATKDLWAKRHNYWPEIKCIGSITGCGLAEFKNDANKPIPGAGRLYRILISEAAHLIWKLRNERIFKYTAEDQWPSAPEIHNRWLAAINERLTLDRSSTNSKFGKKAIKPPTVLNTWTGTLKNETDLPADWTKWPGVLVDVAPLERQGGPDIPDDPP